MTEQSVKTAGVDRTHDDSKINKLFFSLGHLAILIVCCWLVLFDGLTVLGAQFDQQWQFTDMNRAYVLLGCVALYWCRHIATLFYLLPRKVALSEVMELLIFFAIFEIGLLLVGGGVLQQDAIPFAWLDVAACLLLFIGSYLNSYSELQRKWWKQKPENKGRCYTQGLFKHAMHINYFGDIIMFTGWCLFTHNIWTLMLPLLMTLMFIYYHIPGLDRYLADRYGSEFTAYEKKTKKLIPYLY